MKHGQPGRKDGRAARLAAQKVFELNDRESIPNLWNLYFALRSKAEIKTPISGIKISDFQGLEPLVNLMLDAARTGDATRLQRFVAALSASLSFGDPIQRDLNSLLFSLAQGLTHVPHSLREIVKLAAAGKTPNLTDPGLKPIEAFQVAPNTVKAALGRMKYTCGR